MIAKANIELPPNVGASPVGDADAVAVLPVVCEAAVFEDAVASIMLVTVDIPTPAPVVAASDVTLWDPGVSVLVPLTADVEEFAG